MTFNATFQCCIILIHMAFHCKSNMYQIICVASQSKLNLYQVDTYGAIRVNVLLNLSCIYDDSRMRSKLKT